MTFSGIEWAGAHAENAQKLLLSLAFVVVLLSITEARPREVALP